MLDPKLIRNSMNEVAANLKKRGVVVDTAKFAQLEEQRKALQVQMQALQNERNTRSKAVGLAKAQGKNIEEETAQLKTLSDSLKAAEEQFAKVQVELDVLLSYLPNMTHESVPDGKSEEDNQLVRSWGNPTQFSFEPKDHVALGQLGTMDFETGAKLAGARFVVLRGPIARLQRALIQFMLDVHTKEHGYQEIYVPYLVNPESMYGTGQFPKMREDAFGGGR